MKPINLLDDSLQVEVFYEPDDRGYEDNICLKFVESCKEEEKVFIHDETHLFLTREQVQELADALTKAIFLSNKSQK